VLPGETDEQGRFEKFEELLRARHGVGDAHVRTDAGHRELCVHYDPAHVTIADMLAFARATGTQVAKRYVSKTWFVRDMESAQSAVTVEQALRRTPGVLQADVAYASERLVVEFDASVVTPKKLEAALEALGYPLEEPSHGHACSHHAHGHGGLAPKLEVPLAVTSGVLLAAGFALEKFSVGPAYAPIACYAGSLLAGGFFAAKGALKSLLQLRVDIESLMVLAAFGAAILGAWFEGAFLLFLFSVGHAIEHRAMERARRAVEALGQLRPATARIKKGASVVEVPVRDVKRDDVVVVRPGDRVPLDGVIVAGKSSLEQAAITGESIPVAKQEGDEVFCGTVNTEAAIEVKVTKLSTESVIARVVDMVVEAEARKSPSQRFAAKVEQRFVPLVLIGVVVLPVALIALDVPVKEALLRAVSLLVAASPCALAISTPAAVLSAVAAAARGGVLIKGGVHLEALGDVTAVAFDKTGTLTVGKPALTAVVPFAGVTEERLLSVAAAAEALSAHPLASAVVEGAKRRNVSIGSASSLEAIHGKGLRAVVDGARVAIGNVALFEGHPALGAVKSEVEKLEAAGKTTMLVERDGAFLGVLGVSDTLRPEARQTVSALHALGIEHTVMLSGDHVRAAEAVASSVGIRDVRAPLMPQGKVDAVKALSKKESVAMVGDGVNDAPALAAATVGIAMGGAGSEVAMETADVVLMADDLNRLPFALELAKAARAAVRQNLIISLGVSGVLIIAAIGGLTQVSEAVVLHEGSTLLVLANGLRLLTVRPG
jgi:Cd2+/Zn2+-exporting ATPase